MGNRNGSLLFDDFFGAPPSRRRANSHNSAGTVARPPRPPREAEAEDADGPLSKEGKLESKIICALPIEQATERRALESWSVCKLKKELSDCRERAPRASHERSSSRLLQKPLEKRELVDQVIGMRNLDEEPLCVVCYETWSVGDYVRVLPCGHRFHIECIDKWLASKSIRCPVCNWPADER